METKFIITVGEKGNIEAIQLFTKQDDLLKEMDKKAKSNLKFRVFSAVQVFDNIDIPR